MTGWTFQTDRGSSAAIRRFSKVRRRSAGRSCSRRAAVALCSGLLLVACGQADDAPPDGVPGGTGATGATGVPGGTPLVAVGPRCPGGDPQGTPAAAPVEGMPHGPEPTEPFFVDGASQAAQMAQQAPGEAVQAIAAQPTAFPVGEWLDNVRGEVAGRADAARAEDATAIYMIYAIPHRDAGAGHSAGGVVDAAAYREFTEQVVAGIGDARAVVVLEPDSLGQIDTLPSEQQEERYQLLNEAVDAYGTLPNTSVYLDGANCGWTAAPVIAARLARAGVARARGFAVNVANYYGTLDEVARAQVVSALTGGAHFVVDTSRNGQGPFDGDLADAWCNPPGRGLGQPSTTETGSPLADAYLWIKTPGASDGECGRGNPSAGTWWPRQAEELYRHAVS